MKFEKNRKQHIQFFIAAAVFFCAFSFFSCGMTDSATRKKNKKELADPMVVPYNEASQNAAETAQGGELTLLAHAGQGTNANIVNASFIAVGDNLIHEPIYLQAANRARTAAKEAENAKKDAFWQSLQNAESENNPLPNAESAATAKNEENTANAENAGSAGAKISRAFEQTAELFARNQPVYDFYDAYKYIVPFAASADFAFINQETLITSTFSPSTYPRFASPADLGDFLLDAGFNIFSVANNHMLDKGDQGLKDSLAYWQSREDFADFVVSGAFLGDEDRLKVRFIERNGIKIAFVAICDSLNGLTLEPGSPLRLLRISDENLIEEYLLKARAEADFVVVSVHWGSEYETEPDETQLSLARKMADWGADVIIGTHPHVLQTVEELDAADGRKTLVAYSLGNLISAQSEGMRLIGALLSFNLQKDLQTGITNYSDPAIIPLVTHYKRGFAEIAVFPLDEYSPVQAREHGVKRFTSNFNYNYIVKSAQSIIPEQYLKLPEAVVAQSSRRFELWIGR